MGYGSREHLNSLNKTDEKSVIKLFNVIKIIISMKIKHSLLKNQISRLGLEHGVLEVMHMEV